MVSVRWILLFDIYLEYRQNEKGQLLFCRQQCKFRKRKLMIAWYTNVGECRSLEFFFFFCVCVVFLPYTSKTMQTYWDFCPEQFYNLVSVTVSETKDTNSLKTTRIKKKKMGVVDVPNITLSHFLKMSKEGVWWSNLATGAPCSVYK